jgi:hypothetical protein
MSRNKAARVTRALVHDAGAGTWFWVHVAQTIICPVCGEIAVKEKCKIICRNEKCRGRVVRIAQNFNSERSAIDDLELQLA